jgi:branched-chain amino acid transport system ATP-binding protein
VTLSLAGVTAGYGSTTVLRDVHLTVPDSAVVALLGPNGAGKTTLLRVASGLLPPATGQIVLDDHEITHTSPHSLVARGICHVPEGRGIFPSLTVRDNLILQAFRGEVDNALESAVLAFPRLGERMQQVAGALSGGEQQMLALARAYVQHPRVILLDEVSIGLAPKVVDAIFEFFGLLRTQGASLLLVEQYVTRAIAISDYVYLLQRGEVAFAGEPAELRDEDLFTQYVGATIGH